jgi:hypothetical protein
MKKESTKKVVKKKIIGMFQEDLDVWNAKKAAAPSGITDNQLFRNLLHGSEAFGPYAESIIASEMKETGLSRAVTIERAIVESKKQPASPVA